MTQQRVSPVVITSLLPATVTMTVQGALGQSADLMQWKDSTGLVKAYVANGGELYANSGLLTSATGHIGTYIASAKFTVNNNIAGNIGQIIRGATSQTANLTEWQESGGQVRAYVMPGGFFRVRTSDTSSASIVAGPASTSQVPLIVEGLASQTGDLQQWRNSAGSVLAKVDSSGFIYSPRLLTTNGYGALREINSGGFLQLYKQNAAGPNLGSGFGAIYLRDGTNAGTLKLVVRAGAAGAETTILDNIPQT